MRKKTKAISRIASLMLAVMMVLGAVFATVTPAKAANGTLEIHKLSEKSYTDDQKDASKRYMEKTTGSGQWHEYLYGAKYEVYKLADFQQVEENGEIKYKYSNFINGLSSLNASTDPDSINVSGETPIASGITSGDSADSHILKFSLAEDAVYLIKEAETPEGVSKSNNFIITMPFYNKTDKTWDHNVVAYPKNKDFDGKTEKTADINAGGDGNKTVTVGDIIGYTLEVDVPTDILTANYDKFDIKDTSSKSLTIDPATISVKLSRQGQSDVPLSQASGHFAMSYDTSGATSNVLTFSFINASGNFTYALQPSDKLTITYDATVGESEDGKVTNSANISAETDSNTIEEEPNVEEVYTYNYGIYKIDELDAALAGAEFIIYTMDASNTKQYFVKGTNASNLPAWNTTTDIDQATRQTSGADGLLAFKGFEEGTYYIQEVKAPNGYTLLKDVITVTIDDSENTQYNVNKINKTVKNTLESDITGTLPETGGLGIVLYLVLGVALISAAALVYVKSRKKNPTV